MHEDIPEYNTVGWGMLEGYPWWPVYICDPNKLRPKLHLLGGGHQTIAKKARLFPDHYRLVYFFGSYNFSLLKATPQLVKKWRCPEHDSYATGFPKSLFKKKDTELIESLAMSLREAEDFLAQDESMRILPKMVPSDMDPSLEPPPTPPPQADEEDEEMEEENDEPAEESDDDEKPIKPKKKDKQEKKKKKSSKKRSSTDDKKASKSAEKPLKKRKSESKDTSAVVKTEEPKKTKDEKETPVKSDDVKAPPAADDGDLKARLEDEIRNVLSTGNLETLTTRKVRKILSEKLNMDLKDHKETIKEVVNRIIAGLDSVSQQPPPPAAESLKEEVVDVASIVDKALHAADGELKKHVEMLSKISTKLSKDQIATLANSVTSWRSHSDSSIAEIATTLYNQWNLVKQDTAEEKSKPKVTLSMDEILALKDKLSNESTSNDEIPMTMEIIRQTKITIVVAKLRQHANDKVSTAAKDLRNKWKNEVTPSEQSVNSSSGDLEFMSKLETIRRVLEKDAGDDEELQNAQKSELEVLTNMKLTTQQILDSQIGIVVSKLRKSRNPAVAKLANNLKNKWKDQANKISTKAKDP
ncbi:hypothetical protein AeMF1_017012 [Aphanomyces euteiches]|nr:hypothetical protein AeMF1_017012 [Aphanomyces euteiches]